MVVLGVWGGGCVVGWMLLHGRVREPLQEGLCADSQGAGTRVGTSQSYPYAIPHIEWSLVVQ